MLCFKFYVILNISDLSYNRFKCFHYLIFNYSLTIIIVYLLLLVIIFLISCAQNIAKGEKGVLVTFLIFQFLVLLILYAICTVGESLLTEVTFYEERQKLKNTATFNICTYSEICNFRFTVFP